MKLFSVAKVGMFLDSITHGSEKREEEDVKIVTLTLRLPELTSQAASALPEGLKSTLFRTSGALKPYLGRVEFRFGLPRQLLKLYASPDTGVETIAFDQAKVVSTYTRVDKDSTVAQFVAKLSFGPLSKNELAYIEAWRLNERWITFEEAEPGFFDNDSAPEEDSEEEEPPLGLDEARH